MEKSLEPKVKEYPERIFTPRKLMRCVCGDTKTMHDDLEKNSFDHLGRCGICMCPQFKELGMFTGEELRALPREKPSQ